MLFTKDNKRERTLKRILIVEDEPLVAFDNEHVLTAAGYQVVAAVDTAPAALDCIGRGGIDLVLADVNLSHGGSGIEVARAAHAQGIALLFATGACPLEAAALAVGCLAKPYSPLDLIAAIAAVEARRGGPPVKRTPRALTLFGES